MTVLRHQGHRLIEAQGGIQGLEASRAERPDLVITDVLMPEMDGYELIRQLRLDPATVAIPVVFYTAHYGEHDARALALAGGVADILTKPAASAEVVKTVDRVLAGQRLSPAASEVAPLPAEFTREHLRLLTDKVSQKTDDLRLANTRLKGLINIGLDFVSERNSDRRLQTVCDAACALFDATYATLGILNRGDRTLERIVATGVGLSEWMTPGDRVTGLIHTIVEGGQPVRGSNPGGDPATLDLPPPHPSVQAFLAAPIASPSYTYGWICVVAGKEREFSLDDEELIMALAGQVGRVYELEFEALERAQAEDALRRERDRVQQYLDTADVILVSLDLEGRVTAINRKGREILGRPEHELLGCSWMDTCVPPRERGTLRRKFEGLIQGDLHSIVDNPIITAAGEERLVEWHNTLLHNDEGRVVGTLSSGTDITDRTRAADAVKIAEERMRYALEAAAVGIWDMDYSTGLLRWSNILESQYGLQPGAFGGTFEAFVAGVHPEDREEVLAVMARARASGQDFSMQHRTLRPDGGVRWLSGAGRIQLGEHGEPVRGVGVSMDITERHTLEGQYQQALKMEALGRLAAGVSHDFNNLLTVIMGYCDMLMCDLAPEDPRHADLSEIQKAGVSAAGLTRQLLAFSRKQIIEPRLLDLNVVVAEIQSMLARLIGEDVQVIAGAGESGVVNADRGQVEQIIVNLAVNARDAMPHGGTLAIGVANVELDEEYARAHLQVEPGRYVVLTVTDTGTGITPEVQARLFEPFFTTKAPGLGTGLGLATVHGIIRQSGGSVSVYSEIGSGSSFKVYFPKADGNLTPVAAVPPLALQRPGDHTVLVVDDAGELRELTRKLLLRQGYNVLAAANADEARQLFEDNTSIDLILTDVVMPGASGPELTAELAALRPTLRVVYMSGYTEDAIAHRGVLKPGIAFLHKPFTADALGRKIGDAFEQ